MNVTFLRRVLLGDAIFEVACAVTLIALAANLPASGASLLQLALVVVGIALVVVAVLLFWIQRQVRINLLLVRLVMILNALFAVVGLVGIVILWASLSDLARWIGVLIAVGLAVFAGDANFGEAAFATSPRMEDVRLKEIVSEAYNRSWPEGWTALPDPDDPGGEWKILRAVT